MGRPKLTLEQSFKDKYQIDDKYGCWNWTGYKNTACDIHKGRTWKEAS